MRKFLEKCEKCEIFGKVVRKSAKLCEEKNRESVKNHEKYIKKSVKVL